LRRLRLIRKSGGFRTDVGMNVHWGYVPQFGENDPKQVIALLVGEDEIASSFHGGKLSIRLPLNVAVIVSPDLKEGHPGEAVELMLADVKEAMELDDNSMGDLLIGGNNVTGLHRGTTEPFERTQGTDAIGVQITYTAPYSESYGRPVA
jgi:hypothetical protein